MSVRARQEQQLLQAVAMFLREKYPQTFEAFQREAQVDLDGTRGGASADSMDSETLAKRWAATARLQAKLTSQEQRLSQLQEQLQLLQAATGERRSSGEVGLPPSTSACTLSTQKQAVNALCFNVVLGKLVAGTDDGSLRVFSAKDASGAALERSWKAHKEAVTGVACDASGRWVASSSVDMTIHVFDAQSLFALRQVLKGHEDVVSTVSFLPEEFLPAAPVASALSASEGSTAEQSRGTFLLSGSRDGCVRLWEAKSGSCLKVYRQSEALAFGGPLGEGASGEGFGSSDSPPGRLASLGRGGGGNGWVRAVALPSASLSAAKVFATAGSDSTVLLWRVDRSSALRVMEGHSQVVECLAFATESTLRLLLAHQRAPMPLPPSALTSASRGVGERRFTRGGVSWRAEATEAARSNVLFESGLVLFSAGRDCLVKMWDVWGAKCLATFVGHDNWIRQLVVHPGGRFLFSAGDDKSIRIWDVLTGDSERVIASAHSHFVTCLTLDAGRGILASASLDATVKLWPLQGEGEGDTQEGTAQ